MLLSRNVSTTAHLCAIYFLEVGGGGGLLYARVALLDSIVLDIMQRLLCLRSLLTYGVFGSLRVCCEYFSGTKRERVVYLCAM